MKKETYDDRPWYIYIILCAHKYFYTGISPDVKKRVVAHKQGKGARFTKSRKPIFLVYIQKHENMREAMLREREIKKFSRLKKEKLIEEFESLVPSLTDADMIEFLTVNSEA